MRLRYKYVTYHFGADPATQQSLQRHYRQLMDELLGQGQHHPLPHGAAQWRPPADIHETPGAVLVKMELAGMREEDIEVTLYEDALIVTGRREDDSEHGEAGYYHEAQIRYGPFRAEILLPAPVHREAVEARYENGFLRVLLPKLADPHQEGAYLGHRHSSEPGGPFAPPQGTGSLAAPFPADGGQVTRASSAPDAPPERAVADPIP